MTSEAIERTATQATCVHHWLIEAPNGRESTGRCKRCGIARSFTNSTEAVMWEQTNTLRNSLRSGVRISKPSEILLSDDMRRALTSPPPLDECPPMELKNKSQPVKVYRVRNE